MPSSACVRELLSHRNEYACSSSARFRHLTHSMSGRLPLPLVCLLLLLLLLALVMPTSCSSTWDPPLCGAESACDGMSGDGEGRGRCG